MQPQARTLATGEPIVIAGWLIDRSALQIRQADKIVKLDAVAIAVLEYLAVRQGTVVTRQELEQAIRQDSEYGEDAIGASILALRHAFGERERNAKIIQTVAGTGYRLIGRVTFVGADGAPVSTHPKKLNSPLAGLTATGRSRAVNQLGSRQWRAGAFFMILLMVAAAFWLEPWSTGVEPASIEAMQSPLPDKPSIAVLPFANPGSDPELDQLVDAMTADLIAGLTNRPGLFVVARDSILVYRNRPVEIREVAHAQGVRHVLEGSVRRAGVRLRIEVRLFDALSGERIWEESFDGVLDDRASLQQDITRAIVDRLAPDEDL